jgi:hypothetical protein
MKIYHFILIFAIIALTLIVRIDINTSNFKAVVKNKEQIDRNIDTAVDDGVTSLVQVDVNNAIVVNKDAAVNSFFISLNSSFGTLSDVAQKDKLNLYVPVVLVTVEDGYYVFYSDIYTQPDGKKYVSKRWSEKFPYYYEDKDFVYGFTMGDVVTLYDKNNLLDPSGSSTVFQMDYHDLSTDEEYVTFRTARPDSILLSDDFLTVRKNTMISGIEDTMAYYTSRHNSIAQQAGITYNFSLPSVNEDEWEEYLDNIGMFVVFQGYPYGEGSGETYNRIASAGAKVSKNDVYYLEQKGWYLVYHRSNCPELQAEDGIIFRDEPYYSISSAAAKGAYACPVCNQNGAFAPNYIP